MPWFRVDSDWWMTEWLVCLSAEARLAWILLIGHVKANGERGRAKALSPQVAARVWMIGEESVRQLLIAAENAGAITKDDGDWVVTKWRDYQTDPTNAERQAEWKKRHKASTQQTEQVAEVTVSNGDSRYVTEVTLTGQDRTLQDNNPPTPLGGDAEEKPPKEGGQPEEEQHKPPRRTWAMVRDEMTASLPQHSQALALWFQYRPTKPGSVWVPETVKANIAAFREWPAPRFMAAVQHSIRSSYQAIYEDKSAKSLPPKRKETMAEQAARVAAEVESGGSLTEVQGAA